MSLPVHLDFQRWLGDGYEDGNSRSRFLNIFLLLRYLEGGEQGRGANKVSKFVLKCKEKKKNNATKYKDGLTTVG